MTNHSTTITKNKHLMITLPITFRFEFAPCFNYKTHSYIGSCHSQQDFNLNGAARSLSRHSAQKPHVEIFIQFTIVNTLFTGSKT